MCGRFPCSTSSCTHSEGHRRRCEARTVGRWPKHERNAFYALVRKARGEEAAAQLVADVSDEWRKSMREGK